MKYTFLITVLTASLLVSCNTHKNSNSHSHDGLANHSHDDEHEHKTPEDYFGNYTLSDDAYSTKTVVTVKGNTRTMVTNALPNHEVGTFPNPGNPNTITSQDKSYIFPINPKKSGKAQWVREPGVALNGIKFEPGTAEVVVCDTGENYRVEALQDVIDLGLDFNHAHVQPTGAYHYHGTPTSVIEDFDTGADLVHVGFAHDGFPMYFSKSGKYKPSFKLLEGDREGEDCTYTTHKTIDISVGGHHPSEILKQMDANNDGKLSKTEVKGPLKEDFSKIDTNNDGFISKEEIEQISNPRGQRPQNRN